MALDAEDLIESLDPSTLTVTRRAAAVLLRGRAVGDPSPATFPIVAGVQPASGRDLQRLPEERRSEATIVLYTKTELVVGDPGSSEADLVEIDGEQWEVQHVEKWRSSVYYRAIVQAPAR